MSGILEKSNQLIKCFVFLVYLCHHTNEAKNGRSHFLLYSQEANISEAPRDGPQIYQALTPGCI